MSTAHLSTLSKRLNAMQRELAILDSYYDGSQAISFLHPEVRRLVGNRLTTLIINWPAHVLDSIENRLDIEGFRLGSQGDADDDLWNSVWQPNDLDVDSGVAHLEGMLYGRSAVSVWPEGNTGMKPIVAVESAKQVVFDFEPGTRTVRAALKQWADDKLVHASLFYPDRVEVYQGESRQSVTSDRNGQTMAPYDIGSVVKLVDVVRNPLGVVPLIPLVNRRRTTMLDGQSELTAIMPLADAVNKLATDMMVTSEFYAAPRRWATGIEIPASGGGEGPDAKRRLQEEVIAYWDAATKGKTWLAGQNVQFGQFAEADLASFVSAIEMLTNFLGALGVLPPHYMGIATKNPASADAIRSAEASLTKRAQRKQRAFGGTWETAMCYAAAIQNGVAVADIDPRYLSMETVWADPETQTVSQLGDFAQKMVDANVFSIPTAQEWIGMTPQQRERDAKFRQQETPLEVLQAKLAFARMLMREEGLDRPSAFAAVGVTGAQATAAGFVDPAAAPAPSMVGD